MAYWLELSDSHAHTLLSKAVGPWFSGSEPDWTTRPVLWECAAQSDHWDHEIVWCPRVAGSVAIHRLRLRDAALVDRQAVLQLAREEMAACSNTDDTASNVGGYHGHRDLLQRAEILPTGLAEVVGSAVHQAARAEALALRRPPVSTTPRESWFNVLEMNGGWNMLHTHAGSTYSGVLYIADGCCDDSPLAGRLAFVPNEPAALPQAQRTHPHDEQRHVRKVRHVAEDQQHSKRRRLDTEGDVATVTPQYLLVDPTPNTCLVFPSFLPHFVLPTPEISETEICRHPNGRATLTTDGAVHETGSLRVSIAFNFGECDVGRAAASSRS
mmetsp:Transcript_41186/g.68496  ORF Transcript_41186/g.68496 Transcript_41186/m.68496 type:complete len:326 (-) Transcript_41186:48-1025(-)|eukprot:CAMPEP_0119343034 /NCGR_PEP_ID=MMETSP1333-20130426/105974_1 /TAXON_ID=418940 /ORGANISM="Scyphosphaera apsteinii, Strain RCC1455" /LENGTH=325 /DNA_ID=CAMNT_0007355371 /DNA_START=227 /DNA_END=1204 /DNA_ORIENTATION=-